MFRYAQHAGRAVVTDNVRDFRREADAVYAEQRTHFGLVYLSNAGLPRNRSPLLVSWLVDLLSHFLDDHPSDEPTSLEMWL